MSGTRIAFGALVLAAMLLAGAPPGAATVRDDTIDANYLTGYLYWKDGKGGISWGAPRASDDDVDSGHAGSGAFDEFESEAVPYALYLNVSRKVPLDLFFQGVDLNSPVGGVELFVGPTFLTGLASWAREPIYYADGAEKPAAAGYTVDSFRMHAELDTIAKGATIKLRIQLSQAAKYGLAEDHLSVVRLPLFSPDEVLYRIPKYSYGAPASGPSAADDLVATVMKKVTDLGGGIGLAVAVPSLFAPGAARRRRVLLISLLALGMSGCLGAGGGPRPDTAGSPEDLGGSANSYIVNDGKNETGLTNATRGSIYGSVSDPDRLPVNGAHVALLGTVQSAKSDPYGHFRFSNLAPGAYQLRIDRDGFRGFEETVRVEAASITKVEVTLDFVSLKEGNQRPHRHDNWLDGAGKPTNGLVIFDGPVLLPAQLGSSNRYLRFTLPDEARILPGTVDIEVNLTWRDDSVARTVDGLRNVPPPPTYGCNSLSSSCPFVKVRIPSDGGTNTTTFYPRVSGVPIHIRTTWEMTDPGHALYSYWGAFGIEASGRVACTGGPYGAVYDAAAAALLSSASQCILSPPDLRAKVTIHKGVVPLEPAHPDFWKGSDVLTILRTQGQPLKIGTIWTLDYTRPTTLGPPSTERAYNASWAADRLVPYETVWMEAVVKANRDPLVPGGDAPWRLFYRDATTSTYGDCGFNRPQNLDRGLAATLALKDAAARTWTWRFQPPAGAADAPYARVSNWCFYVAPADGNGYLADDYAHAYGSNPAHDQPVILTLNVTAHKDPLPA